MAALSNATYGKNPEPDYEDRTLRVPRGTDLDGAVVELSVGEDGVVTMDIRIPASSAASGEDPGLSAEA